MKKISLLLAMLCVAVAMQAAVRFRKDGIYYRIMDDSTVYVTHAGTDDNFVSANYQGELDFPWYVYYNNKRYKVNGFDDNACRDSYNLTYVGVGSPYVIFFVGQNAFRNCSNLTEIDVTPIYIAGKAFYGCSSLQRITASEWISPQGDNDSIFYGCSSLETVELSDSIFSIGKAMFEGCSSLREVTFHSYTQRTVGTFSDIMTTVKESAFSGCENLERIYGLPSTVTQIDDYAFLNCRKLRNFNFTWLTKIGNGAFIANEQLQSVTFPASLESLGGFAFEDCTGLRSVDMGNCTHITELKYATFHGCFRLVESVTLPPNLKVIGQEAFEDCGITSITLPATLERVHGYCLGGPLLEVTSLASTPPSFSNSDGSFPSPFHRTATSSNKLKVPCSVAENYEQSPWAGWFSTIECYGPAAVEDVMKDELRLQDGMLRNPERRQLSLFTVSGQHVYSGSDASINLPSRGIFFVQSGDGVMKIMW